MYGQSKKRNTGGHWVKSKKINKSQWNLLKNMDALQKVKRTKSLKKKSQLWCLKKDGQSKSKTVNKNQHLPKQSQRTQYWQVRLPLTYNVKKSHVVIDLRVNKTLKLKGLLWVNEMNPRIPPRGTGRDKSKIVFLGRRRSPTLVFGSFWENSDHFCLELFFEFEKIKEKKWKKN